jgi:DNA-binding NarL/FixJ family response regulator
VTLDICLPDMDGLELIPRIRTLCPDIQVLCLSMYPCRTHAQRALRAGASGYLEKTEVGEQLLTAISSILAGRRYVDPDTAAMLLAAAAGSEPAPGTPRLTSREREIMWLLAAGDEIKEVAQKLDLSPKTVAAHRAHLLDKVGVRNNVELAKYLQEHPQLRPSR